MRVLCLTFGDQAQGSTYYRIYQYIEPLAALGICLESIPARKFEDWEKLSAYDAVLLQKALLPANKLHRLRRGSRRLIYDVDDAIWHAHGKKHFILTRLRQTFRLRTIVRLADLSIAANEVLATYLKKWTSKVRVHSMALPAEQWTPRKPSEGQKVRIGWSGHPVNFRYLLEIEPAIQEVQKCFPEVDVAVFSGQQPEFRQVKALHIPFVLGKEPEAIRTFDVGLLPLPDDPFSQGKSPIKGLQYLACAVPVVASPVGATQEMFAGGEAALFARSHREWSERLCALVSNSRLREELGRRGHKLFQDAYALDKATTRFRALIEGGSA